MGDLSKNFSRREFACPCGCGFDQIHIELVKRLQKIREKHGPLVINSGCRCERHNGRIGGAPESSHLAGWAVDLRCLGSFSRFVLIRVLLKEGFQRIGVGGNFLHVDADPEKPQTVMWLY